MCQYLFRLLPGLLYLSYPKLKSNYWYYKKEDYYQYGSLAKKDYHFIKRHTQNLIQSGDNYNLNGYFSPFRLKLGISVCRTLKIMGNPGFVVKNTPIMRRYYILYYKKKVGAYKCNFELHFHKHQLFLCQISVSEKHLTSASSSTALVYRFLGKYLKDDIDINFEKKSHYQFMDNESSSISVSNDSFSTRFIFTNPLNDSLDHLLAVKHKDCKKNQDEENRTYDRVFVHG
jgi:hypothetical protein